MNHTRNGCSKVSSSYDRHTKLHVERKTPLIICPLSLHSWPMKYFSSIVTLRPGHECRSNHVTQQPYAFVRHTRTIQIAKYKFKIQMKMG